MLWRIPADTHEQRIDRWPRPITGLTRNLIGMTNDQPSVRGFAVSPTGCSPAVQGKTSGGKGAKGGNSLQQSDASDSSTISIISMFTAAAGLRRWPWRKPAQTGGNSLQKLCSRNCPHFPCLTFGVHSKAQH